MYPIGAKVIIRSVNHLGRHHRPKHLLGKTGVVTFHDDGMHEVAVLLGGRIRLGIIRWMFAADHLELVTGKGA